MRGTREGDEASRRYNAQLSLHTLRFAINGNLRSPPGGFEEAVRTHFRLLRWRILRQVGAAPFCFCCAAAAVVHCKLACALVSLQEYCPCLLVEDAATKPSVKCCLNDVTG